jgi:hypothetical protein
LHDLLDAPLETWKAEYRAESYGQSDHDEGHSYETVEISHGGFQPTASGFVIGTDGGIY